MQAPASFQLVNIKSQHPVPAASIPRYRKNDLYSPHQFSYIDNHAISVAQTDHASFRDLIYHLIYSRNFVSDLDKTRAIFRWMTSRNMNTMKFNKVEKNTPEDVLLSFKNKKGTYARIFETLCSHAGLYCVVITGYAKGLNYRPGDKFQGKEENHSWNAVNIDGSWYLVDSHWATRYLLSEKNTQENLVYEYDAFYFLPDPEQLIYSHWTPRSEWQLLKRPLTQAEFEELPLVKSYFFKCAMFFHSHQMGVVTTEKGRLGLSIGFTKPTSFTYKITFAKNNQETHQNQKLKTYGMQETVDNVATFYFRAPKRDEYYLTIYAQLLTGDIGIKNVLTASCEYKIIADQAAVEAYSLPQCSDSNWGPSVPIQQLGLIPSQRDAVITTTDGQFSINFQKTRPINVLCKLRHNKIPEDKLASVLSDKDTDKSVEISAKLPERGEYGLEIYGNDPAKDGDTYTHICQYFVHYADPDTQKQAFYQESPQRREKAGNYQTSIPAFIPGSGDVSSKMEKVKVGPPVARKPGYHTQEELENLPPPPPELLQQQYLYGTVPDSRQQSVYGNQAYPQGQGQAMFMPGRSEAPTQMQKGQQARISDIQPLDVQKRSHGEAPPEAPQSFKLMPVRVENQQAPPPEPISRSQYQPNVKSIDRNVLQSVDDHAIQVSKSDHSSFRDLVWDLIYSKKITNELEKVRIIFRWLASKNLKEMTFGNVERDSPEEVLMGLKTGRTTYAMVFDTMCNYAGIHSKIISGYAKGADYRPGQNFTPGNNQHSWNAVHIFGTWCLVDAHWAARRVVGKQGSSEEFHYQLDEYFFLPDPHQLIYTHFPDEAKWQLLERPVSLAEFENMPHMKPQFFKYGLELVSHRSTVIRAKGEVNIRLRYPAHSIAVAFNFSIQFENGTEEYQGIKLNRYGMHESVGGIASFRLRIPTRGSFIIYIYAKEDTPENKDSVYAQVCEYKIEQEEVQMPEPSPFPPCAYLTYGPGSTFYRYNLTTYQQSATMLSRQGKAEMQIRLPNKTIQFMAKLKSSTLSDSDLDGYVIHRIVGGTAYFNCSLPGRGEYGLEIYANDPATEGTTLYHIAQYIIECNEDVQSKPLPKLPAGYLGPQPKFDEFGLRTYSHPDPIIHLEVNNVEIKIATSRKVRMTSNLIACSDEREHPDCVFSQVEGSNVIFHVSFPEVGFYKLQLYAIPADDQSQQLPGIYNYLINCQHINKTVYPFPKQYAQWKEGCCMTGPFVLHRDLGLKSTKFHIFIPNAEAAAIVCQGDGDSEWTHLTQTSQNVWEGDVNLEKYSGCKARITLNANYGGDKTSYSTLLEYNI